MKTSEAVELSCELVSLAKRHVEAKGHVVRRVVGETGYLRILFDGVGVEVAA